MPKRFEDIYHYREGSDKFFFDKLTEITDTINGLIVDSKVQLVSQLKMILEQEFQVLK